MKSIAVVCSTYIAAGQNTLRGTSPSVGCFNNADSEADFFQTFEFHIEKYVISKTKLIEE